MPCCSGGDTVKPNKLESLAEKGARGLAYTRDYPDGFRHWCCQIFDKPLQQIIIHLS